ncbi:MAG: glycosyltransferase family 39 protein [Actinomycetota bacterium]|nr:glycosyltransferase family 39 protein [Actinomycetota bacterium]
MTDQTRVVEPAEGPEADGRRETPSPQPPTGETRERPSGARAPLLGDMAALAGLVAVVAFLWGRAWRTWFWLDEGIAAGISSHSLASIPDLLRQESSPPLYYLLLHLWMSVFGSSDAQTHVLSLLFALAVVPAALWAGWSLFGRRTGWMCALLAVLNPFLAFYATETRMYSMAALLSLLVTATYLHAFVFRRRRYLPAFAVFLVLLLYTHNWGLLVAGAAGLGLVPLLVLGADRRRLLLDAALAFAAVGLAYAPWLPTLAYQVGEDLQPWAQKPTLDLVRDEVARTVGDVEGVVVLGLGAGVGLAIVLRRPWSRTAVAVAVTAMMVAVVVAAGWASSVWAYRYLAVVVPPILLVLAAGLARGGRPAVAALAVAAFLSAPIAVKTPPYLKSNAKAVAEAASARLGPADLVISPDLQMVPLLAAYLPAGLRYATTSGVVPDERIVEWHNSMERLRRHDPGVTIPPLVEALPVGAHVFVACPPTGTADLSGRRTGLAQSPTTLGGTFTGRTSGSEVSDQALLTVPPPEGVSVFHELIRLRCREVKTMVLGDPRLRLDLELKAPSTVSNTPVDGYVLTKLR